MPKWINANNFLWILGGSIFIVLYNNLTTLPLWLGFLIFFAAREVFNRSNGSPTRDDDRDTPDQD